MYAASMSGASGGGASRRSAASLEMEPGAPKIIAFILSARLKKVTLHTADISISISAPSLKSVSGGSRPSATSAVQPARTYFITSIRMHDLMRHGRYWLCRRCERASTCARHPDDIGGKPLAAACASNSFSPVFGPSLSCSSCAWLKLSRKARDNIPSTQFLARCSL
jgi:hypothetical protein